MVATTEKVKEVTHIYDKIMKRILTLSATAVINLINGLFNTSHPTNAPVLYHWTEHTDDDLNRTIADTILTIDHTYIYHIEAQMYQDDEIEFRVFDYGYKYALNNRRNPDHLTFPAPRILQLYAHKGLPDSKSITLDFGNQGTFLYTVPVFKLLDHDLAYLNDNKMIILAPFMMLSLRDSIRKERTKENTEALHNLILDDILSLIESNRLSGDITSADAIRLQRLLYKLYQHLYAHYPEFQEGGLNDMMEDGLVLDCDIWERDITKKLTKELTEQLTGELTEQLTGELTEQLTGELTEQLTEQITDKVSSETRAQDLADTVRKLYHKLHSIDQVADLLDLTTERVTEILR